MLEIIAHVIDLIAVGILLIGFSLVFLSALPKGISALKKEANSDFTREFRAMRLHLGQTLLLSLEVLIVSDVIYSIAHRTVEEIGILGLTVIIRILLAYFLNKELEHLDRS